jgi:hypothetical protein
MSRPDRAAQALLVLAMAGLWLAAPVVAKERSWRAGWLQAVDRRVGDVVSPHALARTHSGLEGISQCTQCHDGLRATPNDRCLECHDDVADRMKAKVGWHGQLTGDCGACHREHRGLEADLLGFDRAQWNHELAAFPLRGAHVKVECDDCHRRAGRDERVAFHAQGIAFERCADCHEDPHGRDFVRERDCGHCHSERGFRAEALVAQGFAHARDAGFPLEGAHAAVPCAECHSDARRAIERAALRAPGSNAPRNCGGCHEDPHRAALGTRCESCHTPARWDVEQGRSRFDHARDAHFPLDALHTRLACTTCHDDLRFAAAGRECADCHALSAAFLAGAIDGSRAAADPHANAATCRDCHAESVVSPTLLDYERACLTCHPAPYASLLVTRKRLVDERVVEVEAALRERELARARGEASGTAEDDAVRAERVAHIARSGLHHAALSETALRELLEMLGAAEAER